ncbi:uncharacterized protein LOC112142083 [Oryzias melastigma]|uniref:uncharacterized protein LOC112142083 n=1 Tax=Oryzias melastigma TaxID=30732 RepID=UPI000CF83771|nr:uncharacterized protein LOC112142083 [Oryzias melastigma]
MPGQVSESLCECGLSVCHVTIAICMTQAMNNYAVSYQNSSRHKKRYRQKFFTIHGGSIPYPSSLSLNKKTSSSRPQLTASSVNVWQWRAEDVMLEDRASWEDKPLHGMYHRTITDVADIKKSYQWLERAGLQDSTEALILAAQEQTLNTSAIEAQIYHTRQDPRCRLCKEETIQHIPAGWKMLAGKANMENHNQVAGIIYRNMYRIWTGNPKVKWETPQKVLENERAKILMDFQIQTDRMVMENQPDIVVVDKEQRKAVVVDVAVPSHGNIKKKEHEKLEKYQGLREELEKAWKVKVTVVPVVIGALGAVTSKLEEWLQQIPGKTSDISVQKRAELGAAKILQDYNCSYFEAQ